MPAFPGMMMEKSDKERLLILRFSRTCNLTLFWWGFFISRFQVELLVEITGYGVGFL